MIVSYVVLFLHLNALFFIHIEINVKYCAKMSVSYTVLYIIALYNHFNIAYTVLYKLEQKIYG